MPLAIKISFYFRFLEEAAILCVLILTLLPKAFCTKDSALKAQFDPLETWSVSKQTNRPSSSSSAAARLSMREEPVLPALGQTLSIVYHWSRARLSAPSWNPTPVTSCRQTLAAGWPALLPALQAFHCSSLPGEISSSDPCYQPQGADLRSDQSRCCRALKRLPVADLGGCTPPPDSVLGNSFMSFVRELFCHFWGTTLKAASTHSPQDTLIFSMDLDAGKHLLFSKLWSFHAEHDQLLTCLSRYLFYYSDFEKRFSDIYFWPLWKSSYHWFNYMIHRLHLITKDPDGLFTTDERLCTSTHTCTHTSKKQASGTERKELTNKTEYTENYTLPAGVKLWFQWASLLPQQELTSTNKA